MYPVYSVYNATTKDFIDTLKTGQLKEPFYSVYKE